MGFRNPVTTAAAVDTGRGLADPGVRLYQDTSVPGVPQGVAEWRTGLMDRNATARLAGGAGSSSFALYGGQTSAGVDAPTLQLNVEDAPAGGYQPVARIGGAPLVLDRPASSSGAAEQWRDLPFIAAAWAAFDTGANMPRFRRDVAGDCHVRGIVKILFGSGFSIAAGGSATVGTLPDGFYLPGANAWDFSAILTPAGVLLSITQAVVGPTGVLTVFNNTAAAVGANYGFTLGLTFPTT